MRRPTFEPALPIDTDSMPWIPTGPGNYVYEPAGTIDGWAAIGDEPCVVHIKVTGTIEYLGENGQVIESVNTDTQRALYLNWCREHAVHPAAQILS
jgi:hypothetical protein